MIWYTFEQSWNLLEVYFQNKDKFHEYVALEKDQQVYASLLLKFVKLVLLLMRQDVSDTRTVCTIENIEVVAKSVRKIL